MIERIPLQTVLAELLDADSWRTWDAPPMDPVGAPDYLATLDRVRADTGNDESVTTGSGRVAGIPVAVVAGNFDFLAGSVGQAAASRIVAAFDRATSLGLPVVGFPTSGGTRMQEGTPAFLQMASIAAAVRSHAAAGLPYLVYLRHPTTGGVMATWGSSGDVTFAQPGALLGFLGPRIYEGLYGETFPADVQTAEALTTAGVIDGVATPDTWRVLVTRVLEVWRGRPDPSVMPPGWESPHPDVVHHPSSPAPAPPEAQSLDAWSNVQRTRDPDRPGCAQLIEQFPDTVELSGTGTGETAQATRLWLALIDGVGCVVVGQDRDRQPAAGSPGAGIGPADLRLARRGMALAERWSLPLVTVIDTQGGELSAAAEHGALAGEISRCLAELMHLATPTVSVLLGGGAGGVALALLPADRVVAAADAWVTPLPPEGASLISHRSLEHAAEMAAAQRITAQDLVAAGAVDRIEQAPVTDLAAWREVLSEELARAARPETVTTPRQWPRG